MVWCALLIPCYLRFGLHTGELALCDAATCRVHILSPLMDVVRTIAIPFCSIHDMPLQPASGPRGGYHSPQTGTTQRTRKGSFPAARSATVAGGAAKPTLHATAVNSTVGASTTGMDYLEYLTSSVASTIAFTDRCVPASVEHAIVCDWNVNPH